MDFHKIKNFFKKRPKTETFHEKTLREKQQKYLFRAEQKAEGSVFSRNKKSHTLYKKLHHKNSNGQPYFSNFFQRSLEHIIGEKDLKHIMGGIGVLLLVLVWYIIIFSPYFKISPNKVLIEPLSQGVDINIVSRSIENVYGQNLFSINEAELAKNIKENLKNTEQIRIDRLLPNGIKILVKSLPINIDATIFGVENKRFGISSNGVLIPLSDIKNENFTQHLTIVSKDLTTELFLWYKKVITDRNMMIISKIFELFEKEWPELKVAYANYFLLENELHVTLESNTRIILALHAEQDSTGGSFSQWLLSQLLTLQTYINNNHAKLVEWGISYLDVRIPGKIFACADAGVCGRNLADVYGQAYE